LDERPTVSSNRRLWTVMARDRNGIGPDRQAGPIPFALATYFLWLLCNISILLCPPLLP
jgi:hypothetical protein